MKTQGLASVQELIARAKRLNALGRMGEEDTTYIVGRLQEIEARIVSMRERDEKGDPL